MLRWEYLAIDFFDGRQELAPGGQKVTFMDYLDILGRKGWELAVVIQQKWYFKRASSA